MGLSLLCKYMLICLEKIIAWKEIPPLFCWATFMPGYYITILIYFEHFSNVAATLFSGWYETNISTNYLCIGWDNCLWSSCTNLAATLHMKLFHICSMVPVLKFLLTIQGVLSWRVIRHPVYFGERYEYVDLPCHSLFVKLLQWLQNCKLLF